MKLDELEKQLKEQVKQPGFQVVQMMSEDVLKLIAVVRAANVVVVNQGKIPIRDSIRVLDGTLEALEENE